MSLAYLITWMMVFLRTIGVILQLPIVAGRPIPVTVQVGLCICLATLIVGVVPAAAVPVTFWALFVAAAGEVLIGLALGFVARMAFAAIEMAGRIISTKSASARGRASAFPSLRRNRSRRCFRRSRSCSFFSSADTS